MSARSLSIDNLVLSTRTGSQTNERPKVSLSLLFSTIFSPFCALREIKDNFISYFILLLLNYIHVLKLFRPKVLVDYGEM